MSVLVNGGVGGAGTAIATVNFDNDVEGAVTITSGAGGNGGTNGAGSGSGGNGGAGAAVAVAFDANVDSTIAIDDGNEGTAGVDSGDGAGGDGGAASAVTLTFAGSNAQTVGGAVTVAADGEGAIVINNTACAAADLTFSEDVGTSSKALKTFTLTAGTTAMTKDLHADTIVTANGHLFDFNGNVRADTLFTISNRGQNTLFGNLTTGAIAVDGGAGGITFDGTADQTVTGAITNTAGYADLTNNNAAGIVTIKGQFTTNAAKGGNIAAATASQTVFESLVFATDLTLTGTAKLTLDAAVVLTADFDTANTNTLTLGSAHIGGTTAITSVNSHCSLDQTANAVTLNLNSAFTSGILTLVSDSATLDQTDADSFNPTDTALTDYVMGVSGANVIVTATAKSAATTASELGISTVAATGLMNANSAAAGDAAVLSLMNAVLTTGGAAATQMAEQVMGSQDGLGATSGAATASAGAAVISVGSSRMAALRTGNAYASTLGTGFNAGSGAQSNSAYASTLGTGFSAGSGAKSNSMWMKPFASFGDQGLRKGVKGYEAATYGMALGGDTRLSAHSIAGLGFSYADTDVDGRGAGRSHSDIRSYQLTAYADYTEKDWYVEGLVGYAYNSLDTTRDITVTNAKATGDTDSGQYMVTVNAGMPMKAEGLPGTYFTPTLGLNYTHVNNKEYTESGAGVLNLKIKPEDITIVKASLGGRLHTSIEDSDGTFVPEMRAKLHYDMAGDDGSSTNTFTGGGAAFSS